MDSYWIEVDFSQTADPIAATRWLESTLEGVCTAHQGQLLVPGVDSHLLPALKYRARFILQFPRGTDILDVGRAVAQSFHVQPTYKIHRVWACQN